MPPRYDFLRTNKFWLGDDVEYDLQNLISAGRFAMVFKATEKRNNKVLAVKVFKASATPAEEVGLRYAAKYEEQYLIRAQDGPHIVAAGNIRNMNDGRQNVELPMDYYEHDLAHLLAMTKDSRGLLEDYLAVPKWYLTVLTQMLEALEFLHGLRIPIVHCDVSPTNILYTNETHFVLADFSCAKLGIVQSIQKSEYFEHIPPEFYEEGEQTPGGDIWALGVLCLDILHLLPALPENSRTLKGLWERSWCNTMRQFARRCGKPEVEKMVRLKDSDRFSASKMLRYLKENPDTQVERLPASEELVYLILKEAQIHHDDTAETNHRLLAGAYLREFRSRPSAPSAGESARKGPGEKWPRKAKGAGEKTPSNAKTPVVARGQDGRAEQRQDSAAVLPPTGLKPATQALGLITIARASSARGEASPRGLQTILTPPDPAGTLPSETSQTTAKRPNVTEDLMAEARDEYIRIGWELPEELRSANPAPGPSGKASQAAKAPSDVETSLVAEARQELARIGARVPEISGQIDPASTGAPNLAGLAGAQRLPPDPQGESQRPKSPQLSRGTRSQMAPVASSLVAELLRVASAEKSRGSKQTSGPPPHALENPAEASSSTAHLPPSTSDSRPDTLLHNQRRREIYSRLIVQGKLEPDDIGAGRPYSTDDPSNSSEWPTSPSPRTLAAEASTLSHLQSLFAGKIQSVTYTNTDERTAVPSAAPQTSTGISAGPSGAGRELQSIASQVTAEGAILTARPPASIYSTDQGITIEWDPEFMKLVDEVERRAKAPLPAGSSSEAPPPSSLSQSAAEIPEPIPKDKPRDTRGPVGPSKRKKKRQAKAKAGERREQPPEAASTQPSGDLPAASFHSGAATRPPPPPPPPSAEAGEKAERSRSPDKAAGSILTRGREERSNFPEKLSMSVPRGAVAERSTSPKNPSTSIPGKLVADRSMSSETQSTSTTTGERKPERASSAGKEQTPKEQGKNAERSGPSDEESSSEARKQRPESTPKATGASATVSKSTTESTSSRKGAQKSIPANANEAAELIRAAEARRQEQRELARKKREARAPQPTVEEESRPTGIGIMKAAKAAEQKPAGLVAKKAIEKQQQGLERKASGKSSLGEPPHTAQKTQPEPFLGSVTRQGRPDTSLKDKGSPARSVHPTQQKPVQEKAVGERRQDIAQARDVQDLEASKQKQQQKQKQSDAKGKESTEGKKQDSAGVSSGSGRRIRFGSFPEDEQDLDTDLSFLRLSRAAPDLQQKALASKVAPPPPPPPPPSRQAANLPQSTSIPQRADNRQDIVPPDAATIPLPSAAFMARGSQKASSPSQAQSQPSAAVRSSDHSELIEQPQSTSSTPRSASSSQRSANSARGQSRLSEPFQPTSTSLVTVRRQLSAEAAPWSPDLKSLAQGKSVGSPPHPAPSQGLSSILPSVSLPQRVGTDRGDASTRSTRRSSDGSSQQTTAQSKLSPRSSGDISQRATAQSRPSPRSTDTGSQRTGGQTKLSRRPSDTSSQQAETYSGSSPRSFEPRGPKAQSQIRSSPRPLQACSQQDDTRARADRSQLAEARIQRGESEVPSEGLPRSSSPWVPKRVLQKHFPPGTAEYEAARDLRRAALRISESPRGLASGSSSVRDSEAEVKGGPPPPKPSASQSAPPNPAPSEFVQNTQASLAQAQPGSSQPSDPTQAPKPATQKSAASKIQFTASAPQPRPSRPIGIQAAATQDPSNLPPQQSSSPRQTARGPKPISQPNLPPHSSRPASNPIAISRPPAQPRAAAPPRPTRSAEAPAAGTQQVSRATSAAAARQTSSPSSSSSPNNPAPQPAAAARAISRSGSGLSPSAHLPAAGSSPESSTPRPPPPPVNTFYGSISLPRLRFSPTSSASSPLARTSTATSTHAFHPRRAQQSSQSASPPISQPRPASPPMVLTASQLASWVADTVNQRRMEEGGEEEEEEIEEIDLGEGSARVGPARGRGGNRRGRGRSGR